MLNVIHPIRVAAAVSVAGLALAMAPTAVAHADSYHHVHLTQHQRHNVRAIVRQLPICQGDQSTGCKFTHAGEAGNMTLASFRADRRTYYVEVTFTHGHGKLTDVEVYR